jgi:hypothetical protein
MQLSISATRRCFCPAQSVWSRIRDESAERLLALSEERSRDYGERTSQRRTGAGQAPRLRRIRRPWRRRRRPLLQPPRGTTPSSARRSRSPPWQHHAGWLPRRAAARVSRRRSTTAARSTAPLGNSGVSAGGSVEPGSLNRLSSLAARWPVVNRSPLLARSLLVADLVGRGRSSSPARRNGQPVDPERCRVLNGNGPQDSSRLPLTVTIVPSTALARAASSTPRTRTASAAVTGGGVPARTACANSS